MPDATSFPRLAAPRLAASTPVWLMRAMAGLVALAFLAGAVSLWAAASISDAARTIGRDAEPSVALALRMAATIGSMNAAMLGDSLTDAGAATGTSRRFGDGTQTLGADLVEAARNITYGEAEAAPLRDLQRGLAMFQRAAVEARAAAGDPVWLSQRVQWASRVARDFAAAPAQELARANASALDARYEAYRAGSLVLGGAAVACLAVLTLALLAVQLWLLRRMRRLLNPPLAAATIVTALLTLWLATTVLTERADLRVAKVDAYDSLAVLFQAKSVANALRADMSLWLFDPAARPQADAHMAEAAQTLLAVNLTRPNERDQLQRKLDALLVLEHRNDPAQARAETPHLGGLLGTELDNITFGAPERQAATDAIERLAEAEAAIGRIQVLEQSRRHTEAVAIWLNERDGAARAFADLEAALDRTIAVNQQEFDRHIATALATAGWLPPVIVAALALAALLSTAGLWLRLREYR